MESLFCAVILGAFCGYLAGLLVAAVFLVMDAVDKLLAKLSPRRQIDHADEAKAPAAVSLSKSDCSISR